MNLLLDTHILLWAAGEPDKLPSDAHQLLVDQNNTLYFSAVSLWEVSIKNSLGRDDFKVEPRVLRRGLLDNGYKELVVTSQHAVTVSDLPHIHKDPFHRMLVAQAQVEGFVLLTSDALVAKYSGPIHYSQH